MTDDAGRPLPFLDSITFLLDSITFRVIEDAETSVEALQAGDVAVVSTANGAAISRADDRADDFSVTVQGSFVDTHYLLIDLDKPGPLQDRRVRCALSSAIDRDQLNEATTNGFNPTASGFSLPASRAASRTTGCRSSRISTPRRRCSPSTKRRRASMSSSRWGTHR